MNRRVTSIKRVVFKELCAWIAFTSLCGLGVYLSWDQGISWMGIFLVCSWGVVHILYWHRVIADRRKPTAQELREARLDELEQRYHEADTSEAGAPTEEEPPGNGAAPDLDAVLIGQGLGALRFGSTMDDVAAYLGPGKVDEEAPDTQEDDPNAPKLWYRTSDVVAVFMRIEGIDRLTALTTWRYSAHLMGRKFLGLRAAKAKAVFQDHGLTVLDEIPPEIREVLKGIWWIDFSHGVRLDIDSGIAESISWSIYTTSEGWDIDWDVYHQLVGKPRRK